MDDAKEENTTPLEKYIKWKVSQQALLIESPQIPAPSTPLSIVKSKTKQSLPSIPAVVSFETDHTPENEEPPVLKRAKPRRKLANHDIKIHEVRAFYEKQLHTEQKRNHELVGKMEENMKNLQADLQNLKMAMPSYRVDDPKKLLKSTRRASRAPNIDKLLFEASVAGDLTTMKACLDLPGIDPLASLETSTTSLVKIITFVLKKENEQKFHVHDDRMRLKEVLIKMMCLGFNVNAQNHSGKSVLWILAAENEVDLMQILVENLMTSNRECIPDPYFVAFDQTRLKFSSVWQFAIEKENTGMLDILMRCLITKSVWEGNANTEEKKSSRYFGNRIRQRSQYWADVGTPLHLCLNLVLNEKDCYHLMKTLLNDRALDSDETEFATFFNPNIQNSYGQTPLHLAAKKGFGTVVQALLVYRFHRNNDRPIFPELNIQDKVGRMTPLMYSIAFGHSHVVSLLFQNWGNRHRANDLNLRCALNSQTCLHLACSSSIEMDSVVLLLCKNKMDVNLVDSFGYNALHLACLHGHILIAEILLKYNTNFAACNNDSGETTLHIAAALGYLNILSLLLSSGSEIHSENRLGRTALHHAFEKVSYLQSIDKFGEKFLAKPVSLSNFGFLLHPNAPSMEELGHELLQQPQLLELEQERQNMVIKLLLDNGGNLDHEDNFGEAAFITSAREQYFEAHKLELMEIVQHPNGLGYTHELFIDKRTQASVKTMYIKSGSKIIAVKNLMYWLVYVFLLTVIAVGFNGVRYYDAFAFEESLRERFSMEEWDPFQMKTIADVANMEDWNDYLENVLFRSIDDISSPSGQKFPNTYTDNNGQLNSAAKAFLQIIGAPRLRQLRTSSVSCITSTPSFLSSTERDICFASGDMLNGVLKRWSDNEDINPLYCGNLSSLKISQPNLASRLAALIKSNHPLMARTEYLKIGENKYYEVYNANYKANVPMNATILDLNDFIFHEAFESIHTWGRYGYYVGGGYSYMLPTNYDALKSLNMILNTPSCGFTSMNTRLVMVELSLYNRETELFSFVRVYVELTASGFVQGGAKFDTFKLLPYYSRYDMTRLVAEICFLLLSMINISNELKSMFGEKWEPRHVEENFVPRYWFITFRAERLAIHFHTEDPNNFRILLTVPCCGVCICVYRTSRIVSPYFVNPFNYIDLTIAVLILSLTVIQTLALIEQQNFLRFFEDLTSEEVARRFVNLTPLYSLAITRQYLLAVLTFFCYVKILEYIQVSSMFAIPVIVIGGMIRELLSFFTIFVLFLSTFGLFQYIAFGLKFEPAKTLFRSIIDTFRSSLGEIDFDSLSGTDQSLGYIFAVIIAFSLVILLLNLLIAVMNEAYEDVKNTAEARWCYIQFRMILRNGYQNSSLKLQPEQKITKPRSTCFPTNFVSWIENFFGFSHSGKTDYLKMGKFSQFQDAAELEDFHLDRIGSKPNWAGKKAQFSRSKATITPV